MCTELFTSNTQNKTTVESLSSRHDEFSTFGNTSGHVIGFQMEFRLQVHVPEL